MGGAAIILPGEEGPAALGMGGGMKYPLGAIVSGRFVASPDMAFFVGICQEKPVMWRGRDVAEV